MNHRGEGYHKQLSEANCRRQNYSWKDFLVILKTSGFDKLCVVEASRSSIRSLLSHSNKTICLVLVFICTWLCLAETSLACAELYVVLTGGKVGVNLKRKNGKKNQKTSRFSKVFLDTTTKNQKKEIFSIWVEKRTSHKIQNQNNRTPGYHLNIFRLSFLFRMTLGRRKRFF